MSSLAQAVAVHLPSLQAYDGRVIFTSGYSEDVFHQHRRLDEDIPLLRKPYKRKELADILRKVLE